jgi:hypothetical protein
LDLCWRYCSGGFSQSHTHSRRCILVCQRLIDACLYLRNSLRSNKAHSLRQQGIKEKKQIQRIKKIAKVRQHSD